MQKFELEGLFDFLNKGVSAFHSAAAAAAILEANGYEERPESAAWELVPGGKYYTTRNGSAVLAWRMPKGELTGWHVTASHSDSPAWKIKELDGGKDAVFARAETEGYGGMIMPTWLDRPLSVAGRILVRTENGVKSILVHPGRALACIPNLCIHFDHEVKRGRTTTRRSICSPSSARPAPPCVRCWPRRPASGPKTSSTATSCSAPVSRPCAWA